MLDENDILRVIKQAAYDANQAAYPVEILTGKVLSAAPIEIMVEQKLTLTKKQLIIVREVTDYTVMTEIKTGMDSLGLVNTREDRVFIQSRIAKQYLEQYRETYPAA